MAKSEQTILYRIGFLMMGAVVVFGALILRLYYLQVVSAEDIREDSRLARTYRLPLPASRGKIHDCNGKALALNQYLYSVVADKLHMRSHAAKTNQSTDEVIEEALDRLNSYLNLPSEDFQNHIAKLKKENVKAREIERHISEETKQMIERANIPGIVFKDQLVRFYPEGTLASHVIGYTGRDNEGWAGVEHAFNDKLDTKQKVIVGDKAGRKLIAEKDYTELLQQRVDLYLTIDSYIQYVVERELKKKVEEVDANYANAVVLDAKNGAVLSLANYPNYDPNHYKEYEEDIRKNRLLTDTYEPGSILKPFVMVAALDQKVVTPNNVFYCEEGSYHIHGKRIRDDIHRFDNLSAHDILVRSSNIGMIKISQRFGDDSDDWRGQAKTLHKYLTLFGFKDRGADPILELPGESGGRLRPPSQWHPSSIAAIPFGQEMSTNTAVLAAAYNAIANRGLYRKPHLIKGYRGIDGIFYPKSPHSASRIVDQNVVEQVVQMLVDVTEDPEGTGRRVKIPGFRIAGKTGTAQKYDPATGTYGRNMRIASFAGFFPAEDPQVVIVVMVDEPKKAKYGGEVAGPVWKSIAEEIIAYWGLSPSYPQEIARSEDETKPRTNIEIESGNTNEAQLRTFGVTKVMPFSHEQEWIIRRDEMPNLLHRPKRDAIVALARRGLKAEFRGNGKVVKQEISPGTSLSDPNHVGVIQCEPVLTDPDISRETEFVVSR